ncbi:MAG: rhodanese-like domain-containing protein [Actinocatenispora sp.]
MPQPPHVPTVDVEAVGTEAVVLDVREPDEFAAGHIADAVHIPMGAIPERIPELPDDTRLVVVCRSGNRSARVTAYLRQEGLDAVNLDGGMRAWVAASRPISATGGDDAVLI